MTDVHDIPDDDALAAEYVLRLLTGDALAEAEARIAVDDDFAAAVLRWETHFATLADEVASVRPDASVKQAMMATLFTDPPKPSIWQGARIWQGLLALSLIALIVFGVMRISGPGPLYTAEIAAADGDFRVIAVVDKTTNEVIMTRTIGDAPEGRILQVWAHGPGAPAQSVGLWPVGETTVRLPMPPTIASVEGVLTLGVSEEPPGGSLTGSPSGRVFGTVDIPGVKPAR
jgi:anti-sigma-K factor RskA